MILNHIYSKNFYGAGSYEPQPQVECRISIGTECMSILRVFLMRMGKGGVTVVILVSFVWPEAEFAIHLSPGVNKTFDTHTF